MKQNEIKYMIEGLSTDLALLLSRDFGMSVTEALDALYNSSTYEKIMDPNSGLYFQGPNYVYSFLKNELTTGALA